MIRGSISFKGRAADMQSGFKGTWCSGITPAQHAGGPGFNPQCVHYFSNRYNVVVWPHGVVAGQAVKSEHVGKGWLQACPRSI